MEARHRCCDVRLPDGYLQVFDCELDFIATAGSALAPVQLLDGVGMLAGDAALHRGVAERRVVTKPPMFSGHDATAVPMRLPWRSHS